MKKSLLLIFLAAIVPTTAGILAGCTSNRQIELLQEQNNLLQEQISQIQTGTNNTKEIVHNKVATPSAEDTNDADIKLPMPQNKTPVIETGSKQNIPPEQPVVNVIIQNNPPANKLSDEDTAWINDIYDKIDAYNKSLVK